STGLRVETEFRQGRGSSSTQPTGKICLMRLLLAASAAVLLIASPAFAQSAPSGDKAKSLDALHSEALIDQAKSGYADAPVDERLVTTRHSVSVGRRALPYTANAGTLTIRDVAG